VLGEPILGTIECLDPTIPAHEIIVKDTPLSANAALMRFVLHAVKDHFLVPEQKSQAEGAGKLAQ
jgi:hypothetical protein